MASRRTGCRGGPCHIRTRTPHAKLKALGLFTVRDTADMFEKASGGCPTCRHLSRLNITDAEEASQ
jgi:hypothetical protein